MAGRGGPANQEAGRGAVARQAGGRDQAVARGRSSGGRPSVCAVSAGAPSPCRPHPTRILPASLLYPARSPPPGPGESRCVQLIPVQRALSVRWTLTPGTWVLQ